jgi:hypothetical protein
MRLQLIRTLVLAFALTTTGCYSLTGGEHNYDAVRDLHPGMALTECIDELAAGGRVEVVWDLSIDTAEDREIAIESSQALLALSDAESTTGSHSVRAQFLERTWGFLGFGEVHLFLDAQDELVGFYLFHVN